jgi:acyl-CoA synthetase (AMP-forming)/AMP-acid ligase II
VTEPAALVFEERRFSLPELDALADGLASTLAKIGVAAGERVAVMASNRPLHRRRCLSGRPARAGRPGGRRRRAADLAAAYQSAVGQGVRVDGHADSRGTGRRARVANHAVADPVGEAIACAKRIMELPQQAVESTKRVLNIHLERAVLASLDYALSAENLSFQTEDFRSVVTKLAAGKN